MVPYLDVIIIIIIFIIIIVIVIFIIIITIIIVTIIIIEWSQIPSWTPILSRFLYFYFNSTCTTLEISIA